MSRTDLASVPSPALRPRSSRSAQPRSGEPGASWAEEESVRARVERNLAQLGEVAYIEVKGWPSPTDLRRAPEGKRTSAGVQARALFAEGFLAVSRLRARHPEARVCFALPDVATYRGLSEAVETVLLVMGVDSIWVPREGALEVVERR